MSTRCGLRLREIAANTPLLHQLTVRGPASRHDFARREPRIELPITSQRKYAAGNAGMASNKPEYARPKPHSVSCIYLCTIETLAGEWPNRRRGEGLVRVEAAYEIRLGERQEAPSRDLVRVVLRADRRKLSAATHHASLLLQSRVLPRSLQARRVSTHRTGEGIMTTIQDGDGAARAGIRPRQVCDHCGGSFGMVTHRWWGNKFCKRGCKDAYLREIMLDRTTIHRWCGLLGLFARSRSLADQKA